MPDRADEVTLLLRATRDGDKEAQDRLFDLVYDELYRIAQRSRYVGRDGETMQATVLVSETYLALQERIPVPPAGEPESRETFFRTCALAMRTVLRDYWRKKTAQKRGGGTPPVPLSHLEPHDHRESELDPVDFMALDAALDQLQRHNEQLFDIVLHRYFGGRTFDEISEILGMSATSVRSHWQLARAWLHRELGS